MHAWQELGFFGGHVGLDFVNSVDDEGKTRDRSGIPDWPTLVEWALATGIVEPGERDAWADADGHATEAEVAAVHDLRETAWRALSCAAAARPAAGADLARVAASLRWARERADLVPAGHGFEWSVDARECGVETIRVRLALALEDLFEPGALERLRECGRCTGLFLDHGRGAGRRWCRMETCGNRAKIERYRSRRS